MPVGEFYDSATHAKSRRKFRRRKDSSIPKGRMIQVSPNVYVLDPADRPQEPYKKKSRHIGTKEMNPSKKRSLVRRSARVLEAAGYRCTKLDGAFGEFDILGLSSVGVILVRICQDKIPFERYLDDLRAVTAPPNCRKMLHVWKPRRHLPEAIEL